MDGLRDRPAACSGDVEAGGGAGAGAVHGGAGVGAVFPRGGVDRRVQVGDPLAQNFGAEDFGGVGECGADGGFADDVAEAGVGLGPGSLVVEFAAVFGGPFEDAEGVVVPGEGGVSELVEDDGFVVAGVRHSPHLAVAAGHGGFGDGGPGPPVGLLAEFVDVDFVVAAAASGAPVGDRKSTRLNSSHTVISYAVFCLKKKNRVR